ncbi:hypothetical protein B9G55_01840 [Saccharibacillus sp. O16]|nr:hypothetical protein B9G55_01840 [Saccharibacillus sp. O16]
MNLIWLAPMILSGGFSGTVLPYFLFGMFVYKAGWLQWAIRHYKIMAVPALLLLALGLYAKDQYKTNIHMLFPYGYPVFCFLVSLGMALLVISAGSSKSFSFLTRPFAAVGRMAFSNYLIQSLVFVSLFAKSGETFFKHLGWFGELSFGSLFVVGIGFFALQMLLSTLWLRHFQYGPFEYLWRWGTNWQRPAWRKSK